MIRKLVPALAALAVALAPVAAGEPYDPSGCLANPQLACGPGGNPLTPFWQDSLGGPFIDPNCAALNTCVPGEIVSPGG